MGVYIKTKQTVTQQGGRDDLSFIDFHMLQNYTGSHIFPHLIN